MNRHFIDYNAPAPKYSPKEAPAIPEGATHQGADPRVSEVYYKERDGRVWEYRTAFRGIEGFWGQLAERYKISDTTRWVPLLTPAEKLEASRKAAQAADAKAYEKMIPPAPPKPREAPYRPEGFSYAHVNSKGQQETPIPAREGEKPATPAAFGYYHPRFQEFYRPTADGYNEYRYESGTKWYRGELEWKQLLETVPGLVQIPLTDPRFQ